MNSVLEKYVCNEMTNISNGNAFIFNWNDIVELFVQTTIDRVRATCVAGEQIYNSNWLRLKFSFGDEEYSEMFTLFWNCQLGLHTNRTLNFCFDILRYVSILLSFYCTKKNVWHSIKANWLLLIIRKAHSQVKIYFLLRKKNILPRQI